MLDRGPPFFPRHRRRGDLTTAPVPGPPDPLHVLFLPHVLGFNGAGAEITPKPRHAVLEPLRDACLRGPRPVLARPPGLATELPGARRRILLEIKDRGQLSTWTLDLIRSGDRWLGVRVEF